MSLTLVSAVGAATVLVSVIIKIVGLPDQIRKNHSRKSTEGQSTLFWILGFLSYCLWTLYGILKGDAVVVLGQGLGVLTTGVIVWQIFRYKDKTK